MSHTILLGQITDVDSVDEQSLDVTIYALGTNDVANFQVPYADLNAEQKVVVDDFRNLMLSLAPVSNP